MQKYIFKNVMVKCKKDEIIDNMKNFKVLKISLIIKGGKYNV